MTQAYLPHPEQRMVSCSPMPRRVPTPKRPARVYPGWGVSSGVMELVVPYRFSRILLVVQSGEGGWMAGKLAQGQLHP